tara:strand:- start:1200 stop:1781 length:582 start_codon:yes stop_codon:yes gene_type:complete
MRIKWLASDTNQDWIDQAISNPIDILIDHAHCERKAAGAAVQMMFRYLCEPGLAEVLSPLAREELEHFEEVLSIIIARGFYLKPLKAPPYGSLLAKNIRSKEPERMMDSFIVSGLIEARSHERMSLIAKFSPDDELRKLYKKLLASEARHFSLYWQLLLDRYEKQLITQRVAELSLIEANILSELHPEPRMHS